MATLRQRVSSESTLPKVRCSDKSNLPVNVNSGCSCAFIGLQAENLSLPTLPDCDGLGKFVMRFFDEQAMQDYIQILHGLIKRLNEKSKNYANVNHWDNLRLGENLKEVEKAETRSVSVEKCSNFACWKRS